MSVDSGQLKHQIAYREKSIVGVKMSIEERFYCYHVIGQYLSGDYMEPYKGEKQDARALAKRLMSETDTIQLSKKEADALLTALQRASSDAPVEMDSFREFYGFVSGIQHEFEDEAGSDSGLYYGRNWEEQREAALERDGWECDECGMSHGEHISKYGLGLNVHHIKPFREFDRVDRANRLENLKTVCVTCHGKIEPVRA